MSRRRGPLRRLSKWFLRVLAIQAIPLLAFAFFLLARTWRVYFFNYGAIHAEHARGARIIYAIPHGRLLVPVWVFRGHGIRVLISEHFDGELITRITRCFGFKQARGSRTRGGARALRTLVRQAREADIAVTPDGPRGPFLSVAPGVPYLAAKTGLAVVPGTVDADRKLELRTWDRFRIPAPFARVVVVAGDPLQIPPDVDSAGLEVARQRIATELAAVETLAGELARRPRRSWLLTPRARNMVGARHWLVPTGERACPTRRPPQATVPAAPAVAPA